MTHSKIQVKKISDTVARQLETYILEGVLPPGERMPAERDLAQQLDVSRPTLRQALQKLEVQGLIETRQGGGTFVTNFLATSLTDPLSSLFHNHPDAIFDFIEFRSDIEGKAAYYAAQRATDADREIMSQCLKAMEAAHEESDLDLEARLDAEFHLNIAESAHNVVLLHVVRSLVEVLKEGAFDNRRQIYTRRGSRDLLLAQHKAILDAIIDRAPEKAQSAAHAHLAYVREVMGELEKEKHRNEISKRRLERYMEQQSKEKNKRK